MNLCGLTLLAWDKPYAAMLGRTRRAGETAQRSEEVFQDVAEQLRGLGISFYTPFRTNGQHPLLGGLLLSVQQRARSLLGFAVLLATPGKVPEPTVRLVP